MLDEATFNQYKEGNYLIANFINMRNMKPVTLQVQSGDIGKIIIQTDEMDTAGDII